MTSPPENRRDGFALVKGKRRAARVDVLVNNCRQPNFVSPDSREVSAPRKWVGDPSAIKTVVGGLRRHPRRRARHEEKTRLGRISITAFRANSLVASAVQVGYVSAKSTAHRGGLTKGTVGSSLRTFKITCNLRIREAGLLVLTPLFGLRSRFPTPWEGAANLTKEAGFIKACLLAGASDQGVCQPPRQGFSQRDSLRAVSSCRRRTRRRSDYGKPNLSS